MIDCIASIVACDPPYNILQENGNKNTYDDPLTEVYLDAFMDFMNCVTKKGKDDRVLGARVCLAPSQRI